MGSCIACCAEEFLYWCCCGTQKTQTYNQLPFDTQDENGNVSRVSSSKSYAIAVDPVPPTTSMPYLNFKHWLPYGYVVVQSNN